MEITVYLFAQYDSRGGTTAVIAATEDEARKRYVEEVWTPGDDAELRETAWEAALESVGPVVLEAADDSGFPPIIPDGGIELDHSYDGPGWALVQASEGNETGSFVDFEKLKRIRWVPLSQHPVGDDGEPTNLPDGWVSPRWDDDAYALILM